MGCSASAYLLNLVFFYLARTHTDAYACLYTNTYMHELFMCTWTRINQADRFQLNTKKRWSKLSWSSECGMESNSSQTQHTVLACSCIQTYLQCLQFKNVLWAFYTKSITQIQSCSQNQFPQRVSVLQILSLWPILMPKTRPAWHHTGL